MADAGRASHVPSPIPGQARALQGLRAGVVSRTIAGAVDYLIVTVVTFGSWAAFVVLRFLIDPRDFTLPTWPFAAFLIVGYAVMVLYLTIGWATTGRSFGARLLGLRVVGRSGARMGWALSLLRAALCTLVPVALFWCAVSRENRSLQDVLLRTSVIHDWPVKRTIPVSDADQRSTL